MSTVRKRHPALTAVRIPVHNELFGVAAASFFAHRTFFKQLAENFLIDIFVSVLATSTREVEVIVSRGIRCRFDSADPNVAGETPYDRNRVAAILRMDAT
jgi:hypothetical protein